MKVDKKRDYKLDLIRVIAFLMIITFHFCAEMGMTDSPFYGYANGGWGSVGTAIFFLLSGYLMIMVDKDTEVAVYYKKRIWAILPLQIIVFIAFYIIHSVRINNFYYGGSRTKLLLSFLGIDRYLSYYGVQSYGITGEWFTAMIIAVYLLFPILRFLYNKYIVVTTIILAALYFINVFIGIQKVVVPDASIFTAVFLFWCGMLIFKYGEKYVVNKWTCLLAVLFAAIVIFVKLPYYRYQLPYKNLLAVCLFVIFLFLGGLIKYKKPVKKILVFFSNISFAAYLCHHYLICMAVDKLADRSPMKVVLLYILLLVIISCCSFLFYMIGKFVRMLTKPGEIHKCFHTKK